MFLITRRLACVFSKWSKPKPKPKQPGDEKAAKLSKSEQEQENKSKAMQAEKIEKETIRKMQFMRTHDSSLEEFKTKAELESIKYYQHLYLSTTTKRRQQQTAKTDLEPTKIVDNFEYLPIQPPVFGEGSKPRKFEPVYGNYTSQINGRLPALTEFEGREGLRRVGALGVKLGMTTMYNRWGETIPVSIVLLDRVQVVQVKPPGEGSDFYQVQLGSGAKRIKNLNKAQIGHFLKAKVPPKQELAEFPVSQECLLPIGYMIGARHFTPGMFLDVAGKTVGHGFSGTIKRYGFARQPATHGNSLTTRVLGSTGGRQDPGRVFKQKKMYGHMGQRVSVQRGMTVFRIDVDKNILYIKGSIPGKAGTVLKLWDTLLFDKAEANLQFSHFPTFVEQPGQPYARQFSMYCGERDPAEIEIHDNAYILDDGEEGADKEEVPKDKDLAEE